MNSIGIGIIGGGKIAQVRHIPEYLDNPYVRLVGLYDMNAERTKELAAKYGITAYETAEALLRDPDIQAVSICTANFAHAELTIKALNAGKHVLCEKPMATTLADCEAMAEAAKRNGRQLMIGMNQRLAPAHVKARALLDEDAIGRVISFRTTFGHGGPETWSIDAGKNIWFFDKNRASFGAMGDLGVHKTDLMQYLLGEPFVRVSARLATLDKHTPDGSPISVDDNVFCIYETQHNTMGTLTASWSHYGAEDNSTVLYGTKGILHIYDDATHPLCLVGKDGTTTYYDAGEIQTNDRQTKSGIIDAWMDCLAGGRPPLISGEEELSVMRAVFAAIRSSDEGRTVDIPENRR